MLANLYGFVVSQLLAQHIHQLGKDVATTRAWCTYLRSTEKSLKMSQPSKLTDVSSL